MVTLCVYLLILLNFHHNECVALTVPSSGGINLLPNPAPLSLTNASSPLLQDPQNQCQATAIGPGLNYKSCLDAFGTFKQGGDQAPRRVGQRRQIGDTDLHSLPWRWISRDGSCIFDIVLRGTAVSEETTGFEIARAAWKLMNECVRDQNGVGGIAIGVGQTGSLSIIVRRFDPHPIQCWDSRTPGIRPQHYGQDKCEYLLSHMDASGAPAKTWGPRPGPGIDIVVPKMTEATSGGGDGGYVCAAWEKRIGGKSWGACQDPLLGICYYFDSTRYRQIDWCFHLFCNMQAAPLPSISENLAVKGGQGALESFTKDDVELRDWVQSSPALDPQGASDWGFRLVFREPMSDDERKIRPPNELFDLESSFGLSYFCFKRDTLKAVMRDLDLPNRYLATIRSLRDESPPDGLKLIGCFEYILRTERGLPSDLALVVKWDEKHALVTAVLHGCTEDEANRITAWLEKAQNALRHPLLPAVVLAEIQLERHGKIYRKYYSEYTALFRVIESKSEQTQAEAANTDTVERLEISDWLAKVFSMYQKHHKLHRYLESFCRTLETLIKMGDQPLSSSEGLNMIGRLREILQHYEDLKGQTRTIADGASILLTTVSIFIMGRWKSCSALVALDYEAHIWQIWSLISQRDSQLAQQANLINQRIADSARTIAKTSGRDSTAMKALAFITMTFLPSTATAYFTPGGSDIGVIFGKEKLIIVNKRKKEVLEEFRLLCFIQWWTKSFCEVTTKVGFRLIIELLTLMDLQTLENVMMRMNHQFSS
ncbi:hypothetical protein G7Y79_00020g048140 [Physcia stellaris]|nr:hypothetical protein G7Y79_00020g048140 [Physcia stellaris]